jgi:hypothetical protein
MAEAAHSRGNPQEERGHEATSAESRHASDRPTQAEQPSDGSHTTAAPDFSAGGAVVGASSVGQPTTTSLYGGQ